MRLYAFVGADEMASQKPNGIIADLLVDFTNVGVSAPGGGDAGDSLFSLVRTLADTKTLACGKNCCSFRAEGPYKLRCRAARGACAQAVLVKGSLSGPPAPRDGAASVPSSARASFLSCSSLSEF